VRSLARALEQAEPEGFVRIFVDEGPPIVLLLRQVASEGAASGYVARLRGAPATTTEQARGMAPSCSSYAWSLVEPLSLRELEVLRLIAAGLSNEQIAAELVVTMATAKKHVSNILGKLNVNSRTQAVARARELRLL
jgi:LuxR family maltose regulon positive regulatory protein